MRERASVFVALLMTSVPAAGAQTHRGEQLFQQKCASCHKATFEETERGNKAPPLADVRARQMSPRTVMNVTERGGTMAVQAEGLSAADRQLLAEWMTGRALGPSSSGDATLNRCAQASPPVSTPLTGAFWDGWGVAGDNGRMQSSARAELGAVEVSRLELKWAFGFPGATAANAQPTVAAGRVFIGGEKGLVHALDARSGCSYWTFQADAAVRSAIVVGGPGGPRAGALAYFGDTNANAYALDARTGALVWRRKVDDHPVARVTGSVAVSGDRLYVPVSGVGEEGRRMNPAVECCTFRGSVVSLDARTGEIAWKSYSILDAPKPTGKTSRDMTTFGPAGASIWNTPTVDEARGVVYVGTGNAFSLPVADTTDAVLAFSLKDGQLAWKRQLTAGDVVSRGPEYVDVDIGSSVIIRKLPGGKTVLLVGQKSGDVHALDPDRQGATVWKVNVSKGGFWGGIEWGMAADDRHVYVPVSDFPYLSPSTPPTDEAGSLLALRVETGEQVWVVKGAITCIGKPECHPGKSAAISMIPAAVFAGSLDGYLRAYATTNGRLLWEYQTARDYTIVNGVVAKGGSLNGPGPAIAGGMLFVNSGYADHGIGGNVLLAFGPRR